ncbi:MAG: NAD(P)-binding oxidoreductase, partial [Devosia sp.]
SALDRTGLIKTARAAETAGVKRYLAIASIGASTGMKLSGEWNTAEMRDYYKQKRAGNKYLHESGLDWIILEPGELTDGKPTGKVTISEEAIEESSVDRADVAAVVVALLESRKSNKRAFQLVGGKTSIAHAVARVLGEDVPKAAAKKVEAKKVGAKK